ncbi:hypothetical protein H5407_17385 [Mitsuaria sp. WAJ17]|uniref:hypothetical protein n=1 Tax=Mitsuaria sp. WAJ17 TaxID=2761452 RepID=UPI0016015A38|nr:hypothetical protein [Mitsuaria sp. WAJ17]MBB2487005.1 hypothetical protein [Mitsuaria sp. WAJ17]
MTGSGCISIKPVNGTNNMAQDETDQRNDAPVAGVGIDLLERLWDARWALRLVCVLLFFDQAMLLHVKRGMWQWSEVGKRVLDDVGWLAAVFVAFSTLVAIVIPAGFMVIRLLAEELRLQLPRGLTSPRQESIRRSDGFVYASDFHRLALKEQSEFLLRIFDSDQRSKRASELAVERMGDLVAAALVAGLTDWLLGLHSPGGVSLIGAIESALGQWMGVATTIVLLCAGALLKVAWFPPYRPNVIYFPPLDEEQRRTAREGHRPG